MSVIYRSYVDLGDDIRRWSNHLPVHISAVAGVPRSGLVPAAMMAQELHVPCIPIETLMGRCKSPYRPPCSRSLHSVEGPVLVLDDTSWGGRTMLKVQESIVQKNVVYGAVYGSEKAVREKAISLRGFDLPDIQHTFQWNIMRDWLAKHSLVDMDGVICEDWGKPDHGPTWEPKYLHFLDNVAPLRKPWKAPKAIVTARLDKYRPQTERWLKKHQIPYKKLLMAPYVDTFERQKNDGFAGRKARIYNEMKGEAKLFIESERSQAERIAKETGLPVLSFGDHKLFNGREPEPTW